MRIAYSSADDVACLIYAALIKIEQTSFNSEEENIVTQHCAEIDGVAKERNITNARRVCFLSKGGLPCLLLRQSAFLSVWRLDCASMCLFLFRRLDRPWPWLRSTASRTETEVGGSCLQRSSQGHDPCYGQGRPPHAGKGRGLFPLEGPGITRRASLVRVFLGQPHDPAAGSAERSDC